MVIEIEENKSDLGKKYIAKLYKDGRLMATYPADKISDIDLSYFDDIEWK